VNHFIYDQQMGVAQPVAHIYVLSIMEWTFLQTHIKFTYPLLTEGSDHMSTSDATTNTKIKYSLSHQQLFFAFF